jgi:nitrogen regulatory protein P-II 1
MKRVEVIIERTKLEEIKHALDAASIKSMTVIEVNERDLRPAYTRRINGVEYHLEFLPRIKLDLILEEQSVEHVLEILAATVRSEDMREVTVVVSSVDEVIHLRSDDPQKSYDEMLASRRQTHHDEKWFGLPGKQFLHAPPPR